MNIFIVDECPIISAKSLCDIHINKMCIESAQMLSTAHRILDGNFETRLSEKGRKLKYWSFTGDLENLLYKPVHINHPCTRWTILNSANYDWHYRHFIALCEEYTYRYDRVHLTQKKLEEILSNPPKNIKNGELTQWPLAMKNNPECIFEDDPVKSYRAYYQTKQHRFKMRWTKRQEPTWFKRERNLEDG